MKRRVAGLVLLLLCVSLAMPAGADSMLDHVQIRWGLPSGGECNTPTGTLFTPDGGLVLTGYTQAGYTPVFAPEAAYAAKFSPFGTLLWQFSLPAEEGGAGGHVFSAAGLLADGGVMLWHRQVGGETEKNEIIVLGPTGEMVGTYPLAEDVAAVWFSDESYYTVTKGESAGTPWQEPAPKLSDYAPVLSRYTLDGKLLWSAPVAPESVEYPSGISIASGECMTSGAGFMLLGNRYETDTNVPRQGLVVRAAEYSEVLWAYETGANDTLMDTLHLTDGSLITVGTRTAGNGNTRGVVTRISWDGKIVWGFELGIGGKNGFTSVAAGKKAIYTFAGIDSNPLVSDYDPFTREYMFVEFNALGMKLDQWYVGYPQGERFAPLFLTTGPDGVAYAVGIYQRDNGPRGDVLVIPVDQLTRR